MSTLGNLAKLSENVDHNSASWSLPLPDIDNPKAIPYDKNAATALPEDSDIMKRPIVSTPIALNRHIVIPRARIVSQPAGQIEDIKQIWDGVVLQYTSNEVTARITDKTHPELPDEIVVIDASDIDDRELSLCRVGAMFYWHIGYRKGQALSTERISKIIFRRQPKWSAYEINQAKKTAKEYANYLLPNQSISTSG